MKSKLLLAITIIFFGCTEDKKAEKPKNCADVWEGTFYNEHDKKVDTKIVRKGDLQVEYYKDKGPFKFRVKWLDSCSYRLTYIPGGTGYPRQEDLKPITINILEVKESSYLIEGWIDGQSMMKYKSELHRSK